MNGQPSLIRPARPGDATDLAQNWVDGARHYAELGPDVFQVPGSGGLGAVTSVLSTYHASPLSVPFYDRGMGYERRSIVFERRLDPQRASGMDHVA